MPTNRFSSSLGPDIPHLAKGEIKDVRDDMYEALAAVAAEIDNQIIVVDMIDAPNVTGGGTTVEVGFQLRGSGGDKHEVEELVQFAVFDDENFSVPAVNADLDTASAGTIIAGGGSAALKVKTDATGLFKCTLTDTVDETVYLACDAAFGGPMVDCRDIDDVTFSA
jgi:hypothetical protein